MVELDKIDLNLLKILKAVVETQNTHYAASQLGISQTTVSRGVTKLKETFGEQLFVRKPHGVEPSELAEKLAEASSDMLTPIVKVLESYHDFEPSEFTGEVKVAMSVFLLDQFGAGMFDALKLVLPKAKFKMLYWQENTLLDLLSGNVDYVLHFEEMPLPQEVYLHTLKDIKLSLIARKNHPVLSYTNDWAEINHLPVTRIIIDGLNSMRAPVEDLYRSKGYEANVTLATHSIPVLLDKLRKSDAVCFGSSFMIDDDPSLICYSLPSTPEEFKTVRVNGGYLHSKRGFPLNKLLHQTIQGYFKDVVQPTCPSCH